MTSDELKQLLLGDGPLDVGLFVPCDVCLGSGSVPVYSKGGPYGVDRNGFESCRRCHERSGRKLVKVKLSEIVQALVDINHEQNIGNDPVG